MSDKNDKQPEELSEKSLDGAAGGTSFAVLLSTGQANEEPEAAPAASNRGVRPRG